ncbi:hypothetical protein C8R44DRAFT_673543 [Mycena epipterygia]|nr:hypothetical protein C8R44DRAFT_673543 [Mycena epipterygia]
MDIDTTPTRVDELWFPDSSLVFQAENSLFRVSGAMLAARSPVFKDMLSFPQPPDSETFDECPVVKLPDSAADTTCFFKAIFDSSFFEPHPAKTDFNTVISVLHLSNKYAVDYLLRRALVHLSSQYPTTLSEWDGVATSSLWRPIRDIPRQVLVIQISREIDALWILPAAFYDIATIHADVVQNVLDCVAYNKKLSEQDGLFFLKTSLHISRGGNDVVDLFYSPDPFPGCKKGQKCLKGRLQAMYCVQQARRRYGDNPLRLCAGARVWDSLDDACCQTCYQFLEEAHDKARQACWDKLTECCDLPSWKELEKMKAKALHA